MSSPSSDPVHALVIVDVQRAFVTGNEPVPSSDQLLANLGPLLDRARESGALVVHVQNNGALGTTDAPGQPGWELYFPVTESEQEVVIRKDVDDAFEDTRLEDILEEHRASRLCVVGMMSEMCVLSTARGALDRDLGVVIPHDGHATYDIGPAPGDATGVPAAMASRVAEWALGSDVEIVAHTTDVVFRPED